MAGNRDAVEKLRAWARRWGTPGTPKAVVLLGPPGVGKTSAALALCEEFGWTTVEMNASDARNASAIREIALRGAVADTFSIDGEFQSAQQGQRKVIIIDEADNLFERGGEEVEEGALASTHWDSLGIERRNALSSSLGLGTLGGMPYQKLSPKAKSILSSHLRDTGTIKKRDISDRGGKSAIIETVKKTAQPIILIANDRRALFSDAEELKNLTRIIYFDPLTLAEVESALAGILRKEGVTAPRKALSALAERSRGDLRSAVNDLELLCIGRSHMTEDDLSALGYRDTVYTMETLVPTVLRAPSIAAAREVVGRYDETPDYIMLWLSENLPAAFRSPEALAGAYEMLARAAVYLGRAMRRQQFSLWSYATDMMIGGLSTVRGGQPAGLAPHPRFPPYLERMARTRSRRRMRDKLLQRLAGYCHMGTGTFTGDMLYFFRVLLDTDRRFAASMARRFQLTDSELAELFGPSAAPEKIKAILKEAEEARTTVMASITRYPEKAEERPPSKEKRTTTQSRIGDF